MLESIIDTLTVEVEAGIMGGNAMVEEGLDGEGPDEAAKGAVLCLGSLNSCLSLLVIVRLMRARFFMSERDTLGCSHLVCFH